MSKEKSTPSMHCKDNLLDAFRSSTSGYHDALLTMAPEVPKGASRSLIQMLKQKKAELKTKTETIVDAPSQVSAPIEKSMDPVPQPQPTIEPVQAEPELKQPEPSKPVENSVFTEPKFETPNLESESSSESNSESSSDSSDDELSESDFSDVMDEEFIPIHGGKPFDSLNVPWIRKKYETTNPSLILHEEIIDFYNFIQPTESEQKQREITIEMIKKCVKKVAPHCNVLVYGSYASGLMLPGSDIDFSIDCPDRLSSTEQITILRKLQQELKHYCAPNSVEYIPATRVPLVRFTDAETGQHGDISIQSKGDAAIETINKYSQRYPAFKYLATVLKYFLKQRGLSEVFHGGLSSFSLVLMIISHLQMHLSNFDEQYIATTSLGTLLIDFLALYGQYFAYEHVAIEINHGGKYRPKNSYEIHRDYDRLIIIDPNESSNNVSGGSRYIYDVLNSFGFAFWRLLHGEPTDLSVLSRVILIDQELVNRRVYVLGDTLFTPPKIDAPRVFNERNLEKIKQRHQERREILVTQKEQEERDKKAEKKRSKLQKKKERTQEQKEKKKDKKKEKKKKDKEKKAQMEEKSEAQPEEKKKKSSKSKEKESKKEEKQDKKRKRDQDEGSNKKSKNEDVPTKTHIKF